MAIRIDVKGLKDVERKLEELKEGLTLQGLQRLANEIEAEAKNAAALKSTQEVKDSIHVEVVEVEPKTFDIKAHAKKEALPFIADATRSRLPDMPLTSRAIFTALLNKVEKALEPPTN